MMLLIDCARSIPLRFTLILSLISASSLCGNTVRGLRIRKAKELMSREPLAEGSRAVVSGMKSAVELNGRVVRIQGFDAESGRYIVCLATDDDNDDEGCGQRRLRRVRANHLRQAPLNLHEKRKRAMDTFMRGLADRSNAIVHRDEGEVDGQRLAQGTKVLINGLVNLRALNGRVGSIRTYDASTERYVVEISGQAPRKIRTANLRPFFQQENNVQTDQHDIDKPAAQAKSVCQTDAASSSFGPLSLAPGSKARLYNLTSVAARREGWNKMVVVVHCFDSSTGRYVVKLPDGAPRQILPGHLLGLTAASGHAAAEDSTASLAHDDVPSESSTLPQHDAQGAVESICHRGGDASGSLGPLSLERGSKVRVRSLTSSAAVQNGWNGMVVIVHCFDASSGRYVVKFPDGMPRRISPEHIEKSAASSDFDDGNVSRKEEQVSICHSEITSNQDPKPMGPLSLMPGEQVTLRGLKSQAALHGGWNGMSATVHCFDVSSHRYVVKLADGVPRKLLPANLEAGHGLNMLRTVSAPEDQQGRANASFTSKNQEISEEKSGAQAVPAQSDPPKVVSICSGYPGSMPLHVFLSPSKPSQSSHSKLAIHNLAYQDCASLDDLQYQEFNLSFVVDALGGHVEVGHAAVDLTAIGTLQGLEFTVFRGDVNTLKASISQSVVELADRSAYQLRVVNAYTGSKPLELKLQRDGSVRRLPLDGTFRLSIPHGESQEHLALVLTDGIQQLHMAFQPKLSHSYSIVITGIDAGLRGEPRDVGLVTHEFGAWTSAEEMNERQQQASAVAEEEAGGEEEEREVDSSRESDSSSSASLEGNTASTRLSQERHEQRHVGSSLEWIARPLGFLYPKILS